MRAQAGLTGYYYNQGAREADEELYNDYGYVRRPIPPNEPMFRGRTISTASILAERLLRQ
jgi:hypothetical protein